MPTTTKTPADRKPKSKDEGFRFTVKGKSYSLPPAGQGAEDIPAEVTMDAVMDPSNDMAQLRLGFATLAACKPSDAAMKALRSLTTKEMLEVLGNWMGGSSASSDS